MAAPASNGGGLQVSRHLWGGGPESYPVKGQNRALEDLLPMLAIGFAARPLGRLDPASNWTTDNPLKKPAPPEAPNRLWKSSMVPAGPIAIRPTAERTGQERKQDCPRTRFEPRSAEVAKCQPNYLFRTGTQSKVGLHLVWELIYAASTLFWSSLPPIAPASRIAK